MGNLGGRPVLRYLLCVALFVLGVIVSLRIQAALSADFVCDDVNPDLDRVLFACAAPTPALVPTLLGGLVPAALLWLVTRKQ